ISGCSYFITTNARYVPLIPDIDPTKLVLRKDMRYGHDDPVLWPRMVSSTFPHLAAIPKAPTNARGWEELGVMWWDPTPHDFVCPASGLTIARGLGRLDLGRFTQLEKPCKILIEECTTYHAATPTPLLARVVQALRLSVERLRMPSTYNRMRIGVTTVQREYLELTGLLRYITRYQPRMQGLDAEPDRKRAFPDNCIGAFTEDPRVAQLFSLACLPFWLIRPLTAFSDDNIHRVVVPFSASSFLEMEPAAGFAPVAATDRLDERIRLLHLCTENTPWYRNPFQVESPTVVSGPTASTSQVLPQGPSAARVPAATRASNRSLNPSPDKIARQQAKALKDANGPNPNRKVVRDKFLPLECHEMPTVITAWSEALAAIDRKTPPSCGADLPQYYVFPEPALLASPDDELRRRLMYHHYRLLRDALMFRVSNSKGRQPQLLTTQEWRDVLQGKVAEQGKAGTRAHARSAGLEDLLRPAFKACGISALSDFPVSQNNLPAMHIHRVKELLWELGEMNFRYEFLALDARASRLQRPDLCRTCFASKTLVGLDFRESQRGLAALAVMDRLPCLLRMAALMCDWSVPCERPVTLAVINMAMERTEWDDAAVETMEQAVARYYTGSFYELFGRAAVVPMRLEHTIGF
ncbi:hypothetical protein B0H14DRAFT_2361849, partial [Mycena olivaceomarginata]